MHYVPVSHRLSPPRVEDEPPEDARDGRPAAARTPAGRSRTRAPSVGRRGRRRPAGRATSPAPGAARRSARRLATPREVLRARPGSVAASRRRPPGAPSTRTRARARVSHSGTATDDSRLRPALRRWAFGGARAPAAGGQHWLRDRVSILCVRWLT